MNYFALSSKVPEQNPLQVTPEDSAVVEDLDKHSTRKAECVSYRTVKIEGAKCQIIALYGPDEQIITCLRW